MTDFEKAKAYLVDRNHRLVDINRQSKIPLSTLNEYRKEPERLRTAAWETVHRLAKLADKNNNKS